MKAMSPSELDEWNRLQAVRRAAAGDVSTDAVHVEHITGADAVALVGYSVSDEVFLLPASNDSRGRMFASTILKWSQEGRVNGFGTPVSVVETVTAALKSHVEAAHHSGKLATVFGASSQLLATLPALYELVAASIPCVLHISVDSRETMAEVLAARNTGVIIMWARSAQEAFDFALTAAFACRTGNVPIIVCQDGLGVANDFATVQLKDTEQLSEYFKPTLEVHADGEQAQVPPSPSVLPDLSFSQTAVPRTETTLASSLHSAAAVMQRTIHSVNYYGPVNATTVVFVFGPGSTPLEEVLPSAAGVGLLVVRALRPFPSSAELQKILPATVTTACIINTASISAKCPANSAALAEDIVLSLHESGHQCRVVQMNVMLDHSGFGRHTAQAVYKEVLDGSLSASVELRADELWRTNLSTGGPQPSKTTSAIVWSMDTNLSGSREAAQSTVAALGSKLHYAVQGGVAESAESNRGVITKFQVRFGEQLCYMDYDLYDVDLIVCHAASLLLNTQLDVLANLRHGGSLFLNCSWDATDLETMLPEFVKHKLANKNIQIYVLDTTDVCKKYDAREDAVLQACFFKLLTKLSPQDVASAVLHHSLSALVVDESRAAIDQVYADMAQVSYPATWKVDSRTVMGVAPEVFHPVVAPESASVRMSLKTQPRPYVDLLHHVFGDRVLLADARDTVSLFGEKYVKSTAVKDVIHTVFSQRPEFCFGVHLAMLRQRTRVIGEAKSFLDDADSCGGDSELRSVVQSWYDSRDDPFLSVRTSKRLLQLLGAMPTRCSRLNAIYAAQDVLPYLSKWVVGSDSWSTDIGYSGIHHVMASGQNINILILENTPHTAEGHNPAAGQKTKKDIGLYCMNYGNSYVASISLSASHAHAVRALAEADAFNGPSIILAYAADLDIGDCAEHNGSEAVEWPLYRWNPTQDDPFHLDSASLRKDLDAFVQRQTHLTLLSNKEHSSAADFHTSFEHNVSSLDQSMTSQMLASSSAAGSIDMNIIIAYGSDSGKGAGVAERIKRKAELRNVREVTCIEANELTMEGLAAADVAVFVMSTAGQGEMCGNAKQFWGDVSQATSSSLDLQNVRFGVFGLGDSHYWGDGTAESAKYFCLPAVELDDVLVGLGAKKVLDVGLGDDQHANGFNGDFEPWQSALFTSLGVHAVVDENEVSAVGMVDDTVKLESNYLRGTLLQSLADTSTGAILPEDAKISKFHGIYQQDDRDIRPKLEAAGKERAYTFMVRVGIPGGVATPEQYLAMSALSRSHANGGLKLTTRQAFQLHGIIKGKLKPAMQGINRGLMDTLAACGDVNRNVMASPNPFQSGVHAEVLAFSQKLNLHLKPQTAAYQEVWLDKYKVVADVNAEVEPLYGPTYLPRKFKIAIAVPPMNDVDVFSHCLGYIAIVINGKLVGYNVSVGGGMGTTHGNKKTYPRLGDLLGFVTQDQAIDVGEKVMTVQRDFGDRKNRKHARCKYTVEDRGIAWYRAEVERRCGYKIGAARPFKFTSNGDRFGWNEGVDGKWHYTMFVENGRVYDTDRECYRSGLDEIARVHTGDFRLTGTQNIIIGGVTPEQRPIIERLLAKHKIDNERFTGMRRNSMACVALPTCALAMAESERYLPKLVTKIDTILDKHGLRDEPIVIRMSGCPNGCSRPWMAEIVFVGKAPETYNMYLGGGFSGNRIAKIYKESVKEPEILRILDKMIAEYANEKEAGEHFGDFVIRKGHVEPTLAGNRFWDTTAKGNKVEGVPPQVYW